MKKIGFIILIAVIVIIGGVEIYFTTQKSNIKTSTSSESKKENSESQFLLKDNGKEIILGEVFSKDVLGEEESYSEIASCAFEGLDKTYTYANYEITTFPDGNEDRIYTIYFLNTEIATTEGIKISDSMDQMINTYGENYTVQGNQYTYTKGKTNLEFIVENGVITSIQYSYHAENEKP